MRQSKSKSESKSILLYVLTGLLGAMLTWPACRGVPSQDTTAPLVATPISAVQQTFTRDDCEGDYIRLPLSGWPLAMWCDEGGENGEGTSSGEGPTGSCEPIGYAITNDVVYVACPPYEARVLWLVVGE